jgi:hypothetical protein
MILAFRCLSGTLAATFLVASLNGQISAQNGRKPPPLPINHKQFLPQRGTTDTMASRQRELASVSSTLLNEIVTETPYSAKCDGSSDDTLAIQTAVTALAGAARVVIPNGKTCTVSGINVPSNTYLVIDGTLKMRTGVNKQSSGVILLTSSPSNVTVDGGGIIDGNSSGQSDGPQAGIYAFNATNVHISGITVQNTQSWPINVVASNAVWIDKVNVLNGGNSTEFAQGTHNARITNCSISGTADYGFAFYGGVYDAEISGCLVSGTGADGVAVLNDTGAAAPCNDILIANNILTGNQANGVGVRTDNGLRTKHSAITIVGNHVYGNNQSNTNGYGGIYLQQGNQISVKNNTIHNDGNGKNSSIGISLGSAVEYPSVIGNTIYNEGIGSGLGIGVSFGGATQVYVTANHCYTQQAFVTLAHCTNGLITSGLVDSNYWAGPTIGAPDNATYAAVHGVNSR